MVTAFRHVSQKSQKVSIIIIATVMSICTPACITLAPHRLMGMKFDNGDFH